MNTLRNIYQRYLSIILKIMCVCLGLVFVSNSYAAVSISVPSSDPDVLIGLE